MGAVCAMAMFSLAAKLPIKVVGENDKNRRRNDQPNYIGGKKMFYC